MNTKEIEDTREVEDIREVAKKLNDIYVNNSISYFYLKGYIDGLLNKNENNN